MKEYKVKDNQDIFAVAVELYGSPAYAFKIANDNDLEINDSLTGLTIEYDETIKDDILTPFLIVTEPSKNLVQTFIPASNQSIFDIALMTTGSIENIIQLVKDSTIEYLNSDISPSDRFYYTDSGNDVKRYLSLTGRVFSNKPDETDISREFDDSFSRVQFT